MRTRFLAKFMSMMGCLAKFLVENDIKLKKK